MPVVINDFEVVSDPAQRQGTATDPTPDSVPQEKPDYNQARRHWREREERVRAH